MAKSLKLSPLPHASWLPNCDLPLLTSTPPPPPLSEHKVLGMVELGGTGMLLYLASSGVEEQPTPPPSPPPSCPPPPHKHSRERANARAHMQKLSLRQSLDVSRAGNRSAGTYLSFFSRHLTKMGRMPDFIKSSMGGFLSLESSFLEEKQVRGRCKW